VRRMPSKSSTRLSAYGVPLTFMNQQTKQTSSSILQVPKPLSTIRIGLVGAGAIAATHAQHLSTFDFVTIAGVYDALPERSAEFAAKRNITAYLSLGALLGQVDAIYICTFPQAHREAAIRAAQAGVHVCCEKPLAKTLEDGLAIQEAVEKAGISFMVAFPWRFTRNLMRIKEVVDSGVLGQIYSFYAHVLVAAFTSQLAHRSSLHHGGDH